MKPFPFLLFFICSVSYAQQQNLPKFRSTENKNYWKNKAPHSSYWQQDVVYNIDAELDDSLEIIDGNLELHYFNNSPHTLKEAFFHLYQNSNQPGSLTDKLYNVNKIKVNYGKYEGQNLGTTIQNIQIGQKNQLEKINETDFEVNYTLLKIKLPQELKSGDSIVFKIKFKTYFDRGSIRRRMKVFDHHGIKHFNGVHWYPRICVYDQKFGWETSQHLEKEFYGDFGEFKVNLTLPQEYIVEGTGTIVNESEVLPASLLQQLDVRNFKNKKPSENPSIIIPKSNKKKTWQFHALNVHDFAWTADPTYRISKVKWNNINCIAIVQENNAPFWQQTAQFTAEVIALYSSLYGMYEYPKIVVADAADGMEYPMLTLCGGYFPQHKSLIAHEVGHNWFMGMVGSNETYRASLDEGFTQFLTAVALRKLNVERMPEYSRVYAGYIEDAIDGTDAPLNTHSNEFGNAVSHGGGYKHVYFKTATMLYNLQYFLGDSLFEASMKNYVQQWKFCHPYVEDFRNSIIASSQVDLNKFFDQWFESTDFIDYGIKKVTKIGPSKYEIEVQRNGSLIMPLHISLYSIVVDPLTKKSKLVTTPINIPVNQYKDPYSVNTRIWDGWGKINPTFSFKVQLQDNSTLKQVWIDPSGRLADVYRVNNTWKNKHEIHFDWGNGENSSYLGGYQWLYRPALTFNQYSGLLAGMKLSGQYAGRKHQIDARTWVAVLPSNFDLNIQYPQQKISFDIKYNHEMRKGGEYFSRIISYNQQLNLSLGWKMKFLGYTFGLYGKHLQSLVGKNAVNYQKNSFEVNSIYENQYAGIIPSQSIWSHHKNTSLNVFIDKSYSGWGERGDINMTARLISPWSEVDYGYVNFTWKHYSKKLKYVDLKSRLFIQIGHSNAQNGEESLLYAAGANPEQQQEQYIVRDINQMPLLPARIYKSYPPQRNQIPVYLHSGGGLNLRGYNGRVLGLNTNDTTVAFFRGTSGVALNIELGFAPLLSGVMKNKYIKFSPYLFADIGQMGYKQQSDWLFSGALADAGIGTTFQIKNLNSLFFKSILNEVKPINFRLDLPIFLNTYHPSESALQLRVVFGVDYSF